MNAQEKERHEEQRWMAQPVTPRDDMRRAAWGSLLFQISPQGRCTKTRKCLWKESHQGDCWPT